MRRLSLRPREAVPAAYQPRALFVEEDQPKDLSKQLRAGLTHAAVGLAPRDPQALQALDDGRARWNRKHLRSAIRFAISRHSEIAADYLRWPISARDACLNKIESGIEQR